MFGRPIPAGKLFGIKITISWSFVLLVAFLALTIAARSGNFLLGFVVGVALLSLTFGSVLLHELGHSLVARQLGVRIAEIELHFFGGAAKMLTMPRTPRDEILIAAAGPLVSFALAGIFAGLAFFVPAEAGPAAVIGHLAFVNVILGAFNLLPALPMDGGRILRAALTPRHGALKATRIAVTVARVVAVGVGVWGLVAWQPFAVAIAAFVWLLGTRELRLAQLMHRRSTPSGFDVLDRDGRRLRSFPGGSESQPWGTPQPRPDDRVEGFRQRVVRGPDGRLWMIVER